MKTICNLTIMIAVAATALAAVLPFSTMAQSGVYPCYTVNMTDSNGRSRLCTVCTLYGQQTITCN